MAQFIDLTRQIWLQREPFTRPASPTAGLNGGGYAPPLVLDPSHLLARIWLIVSYRLPSGGTVALPAAGRSYLCDVIRRVIFRLNVGGTIFDVSGRGIAAGIMPYLESEYFNPQAIMDTTAALQSELVQSFSRPLASTSALTLGSTYTFWMVIPFMFNLRDARGFIPLQNEQLRATLVIDFESEAALGFTGAPAAGQEGTVTVYPWLELFTLPVPSDPTKPGAEWPDFSVIQMYMEEDKTLKANSPQPFQLSRGGIYEQIICLIANGKVGASSAALNDSILTGIKLRAMQTDYLIDATGGNSAINNYFNAVYHYYHGHPRIGGTYPFDFMASSGLGNYGVPRDLLNMLAITDVQIVPTVSADSVMTVVQRLLVPLATPLYPPPRV